MSMSNNRFMRVRTLLLAAVLLLPGSMLAACGNNTGSAEGKSGDATAPIVIGLSASVTGENPLEGENMKNGVQMAVDEINEKGGVLGRPLKILVEDDKNTTSIAVNAVNKLLGENITALIGPHRSGNAVAVQKSVAEKKIPYLTGASSPTLLEYKNPYLFRIRASDNIVASSAAKFLTDNLGCKTLGMLYDNGDFGVGAMDVIDAYCTAAGIPLTKEGYNSGDKDFTSQIMKMKNANVEGIVMWTNPAETAIIVRQIKELGLSVPIIGSTTITIPEMLDLVQAEDVEGYYGAVDFSTDSTDPNTKAFVDNYRAKYSREPSNMAIAYYDGVYLLADTLTRAGSTDEAALRKALMETKDLQGAMSVKTANENGEMIHSAVIVQIKDKKPTTVTTVKE